MKRTPNEDEITQVLLKADREAFQANDIDASAVLYVFLTHFTGKVSRLSIDREPLDSVVSPTLASARQELVRRFGPPTSRPFSTTEVVLDKDDANDRRLYATWAYGSLLANVWGERSQSLFEAADCGESATYVLAGSMAREFLDALTREGIDFPDEWRNETHP